METQMNHVVAKKLNFKVHGLLMLQPTEHARLVP